MNITQSAFCNCIKYMQSYTSIIMYISEQNCISFFNVLVFQRISVSCFIVEIIRNLRSVMLL